MNHKYCKNNKTTTKKGNTLERERCRKTAHNVTTKAQPQRELKIHKHRKLHIRTHSKHYILHSVFSMFETLLHQRKN